MDEPMIHDDPVVDDHHGVKKKLKCGLCCVRCMLCDCRRKTENDDLFDSALDLIGSHILAFKDVGEDLTLSTFGILKGLNKMAVDPRPMDTCDADNAGFCAFDATELEEIVIYCTMASASYGLKVYALTKGLHGVCGNRIGSDKAAFLHYTGIAEEDLIFGRFETATYQPGFVVARISRLKQIVICIRGTLEVDDVVTDGVAESVSIQIGGKVIGLAHCGMLKAAQWLKKTALPHALKEVVDEYQLVITGHSMGAGAATILSVILQNDPELAHLKPKCVVFAPPPTLSLDLSRSVSHNTTTITRGFDVCPTLSMHSVFALREWMVKPKDRSINDVVIDMPSPASLQRENSTPITPRRKHHEYAIDEGNRLYLAGRVYHIPAPVLVERRCWRKNRKLESVFEVDANEFQTIYPHKMMVIHHLPWGYESCLKKILQQMSS